MRMVVKGRWCFCFRVGLALIAGPHLAALGLQATTLNAIRDAWSGGLGEIPGRRTSLFCQDLIPDSQTWITVPGIGPGTGTSCGSFLMPGNGNGVRNDPVC